MSQTRKNRRLGFVLPHGLRDSLKNSGTVVCFTILLAIGTGLVSTRFAVISWLVFLGSIGFLLGRRVSFRVVLWTYVIFFSLLTVIYGAAWLVRISLPPQLILLAMAAFSWLAFAWLVRAKAGISKAAVGVVWPGVLVAGCVCLYAALPLLQPPLTASIVRFAARTGDDISHVGLIEADRATAGYVYDAGGSASRLIERKFIGYPQGWHVNGAFWESMAVRFTGADTMIARLASYLGYKLFWLFIATYFIYELFLAAAAALSLRQDRMNTAMAAVSTCVLSLGLLIPLYGYGFQNFIAAIALVCAAACLAIWYANVKNSALRRRYIAGLILLTVAATYVWVLPGVTVGLLTLAVIAHAYRTDRGALRWWHWAMCIVAMTMTLLQAYATHAGGSAGAVSSLLAGGAVPPVSVIGLMLIYGVGIFFACRASSGRRNWLLLLFSASAIGFVSIAAYQIVMIGEVRYYAIKLAYMSAMIGGILLLALIAATVRLTRWPRYGMVLFFVVALGVLPFVLGLDLRASAFPLKHSAPITVRTAEYMSTLPAGDPAEVIQTASPEESYLATRLWSDIRPYSDASREALLDKLSRAVER